MSRSQEQRSAADRLLRVDFLAGVMVGIIALAVWLQAYPLPMGEVRNFGAGFLPKILGTVIAVGAVVLMVRGWLQPEEQAERLQLMLRGPAAVAIGILFFACFIRSWQIGPLTTPQLGLMIVGPATVVLSGLGSKEADVRELVVLGLGLTALITILFADLLSMHLPLFPGAIEPLIRNSFGHEWPKRFAYLGYLALCLGLSRAFGFRPFSLAAAKDAE